MDAYALAVNPRTAVQQRAYSHHLVFRLHLAALPVDGLFECGAAIRSTPVVLDVNDIALLGHHHFPHPDIAQPAVADELGVGPSIYIDDQRIFLRRIEIPRIEEAVVVVADSVRGLDRAHFNLALGIFVQRVGGGQDAVYDRSVGIFNQGDSRHVEAAVAVDEL